MEKNVSTIKKEQKKDDACTQKTPHNQMEQIVRQL